MLRQAEGVSDESVGSTRPETVGPNLCTPIRKALTLVIKSGDSLPPTMSRRVWGLAKPMSDGSGGYYFDPSKRTYTWIFGICEASDSQLTDAKFCYWNMAFFPCEEQASFRHTRLTGLIRFNL
jgi:hypothetical protein